MKPLKTKLAATLTLVVCAATHTALSDEPLWRRAEGRYASGLWLTEEGRITASDADQDDRFGLLFGSHQAVLGDTLVVGSYLDDNAAGVDAGSAYLFERSEGSWVERQHFIGSDTEAGDTFGGRTAISEDFVFIAAIWDHHSGREDAGSVYVFSRTPGGLVEQQKLIADTPVDFVSFGWALAVDGDTLAVGSARWWAPDEIGTVHVFTQSQGTWSLDQVLTASDASPGDNFGHFVAISGDLLVIGAPQSDHSGVATSGAVYIFHRVADEWIEHQVLTASDPDTWDGFGVSVALSGDLILIGAGGRDRSGFVDCGAAYVFERVGQDWVEQQMLFASDGDSFDMFGDSVNLAGDTAVISAVDHDLPGLPNAGAVYVFPKVGDSWIEREKCTAADAAADDRFGWGMPLSGHTIVMGAAMDDHSGLTDAGSVYVYRLATFADDFESGDTTAWSSTVP